MNTHRKPLGTATRRTVLAAAAGGTVAAVSGLAILKAQASTTDPAVPSLRRAGNQPGPLASVAKPMAAASLVTVGLDFAWSKPRASAM